MSRPATTSCATTAWSSARRTSWAGISHARQPAVTIGYELASGSARPTGALTPKEARMNLKQRVIAAALLAGAALPAFAQVGVSINIGAPVAPPPAVIYEAPPPPPAPAYVWAPGYWGWQGERYVWVKGRYVYGRPGYVWRPDRWEQRGPHYHHVSDYWEREHHGKGWAKGHGKGRH